MSVGIDLGSSTVKVIQNHGSDVHRLRPVDPELAARVGTAVPLVRRVGRGASVEAPNQAYVRELARVLNGAEGEAFTAVVPDWWSGHARTLVAESLRATVTVPVALESAALAAVRAAALAHELPETVAVLDIGAETSSATVVTDVHAEARIDGRPTVLTGRGGNELDRRLVQHILNGLQSVGRRLDPTEPSDRSIGTSLLSDVRNAKEQLSIRPSVSLATQLPGSESELRIVRAEFDEVADGTVQALIGMLHAALEYADHRVGAVLLVGGGGSIPLVSQHISTDLGLPVILDDDPATLAVRGAALREFEAPTRQRRLLRRKAPDESRIVFALAEQPVVPLAAAPVRTAPSVETPPPVEPAAVVEAPAPAPEPASPTTPVAPSTGPVDFDADHPLEIVVETAASGSPVARTAARWVTADGTVGTRNPEGRVDESGGVAFRIEGTVHRVHLATELAGSTVTVVILGLHVLVTETATGNLLRELRLDPEHSHRPE